MASKLGATKLGCVVLAASSLVAVPAVAHHSAAMFDRSRTVQIKGTVKQYLYTNPHCWITIVSVASGESVNWDVEGYTPQGMQRFGMVPSTVKPGDMVTVSLHPLRDGRHGGSLVSYTFPDGKIVDTSPDNH